MKSFIAQCFCSSVTLLILMLVISINLNAKQYNDYIELIVPPNTQFNTAQSTYNNIIIKTIDDLLTYEKVYKNITHNTSSIVVKNSQGSVKMTTNNTGHYGLIIQNDSANKITVRLKIPDLSKADINNILMVDVVAISNAASNAQSISNMIHLILNVPQYLIENIDIYAKTDITVDGLNDKKSVSSKKHLPPYSLEQLRTINIISEKGAVVVGDINARYVSINSTGSGRYNAGDIYLYKITASNVDLMSSKNVTLSDCGINHVLIQLEHNALNASSTISARTNRFENANSFARNTSLSAIRTFNNTDVITYDPNTTQIISINEQDLNTYISKTGETYEDINKLYDPNKQHPSTHLFNIYYQPKVNMFHVKPIQQFDTDFILKVHPLKCIKLYE